MRSLDPRHYRRVDARIDEPFHRIGDLAELFIDLPLTVLKLMRRLVDGVLESRQPVAALAVILVKLFPERGEFLPDGV